MAIVLCSSLKPFFSFYPPISLSKPTLHRFKYIIPKTPLLSSFTVRSRNGGSIPPLPETECPVPADQQPINEYQNLSTSFPFSWASGDLVDFCMSLFVVGASFSLLVALPVAWFGTVGAESEPLKRIVGAVSSGVFVVTLAVVRMYLGWAYVGNRLLSATVEYEETGWYDGQVCNVSIFLHFLFSSSCLT